MTSERIKDLKDLQILLQATKSVVEPAVDKGEQTPFESCEEFDQEDDDFSDEEIRATLKQHDFWLGYLTAVREAVLKRAGYCCQMCGSPAPFMDAKGKPFLVVHHVDPAKNGDISIPDNLVALCPNCHCKVKVNATPSEKKKLQKLAEKYKEQELEILGIDPKDIR